MKSTIMAGGSKYLKTSFVHGLVKEERMVNSIAAKFSILVHGNNTKRSRLLYEKVHYIL